VHGARNQLLAGAAFALNHDCAVGRGYRANRLFQPRDGRTRADYVIERIAGRGIPPQRLVLAP
jgi:hypothetical protein